MRPIPLARSWRHDIDGPDLMRIAFNALSLRPENEGGRRMMFELVRTLVRQAPEHDYTLICTKQSIELFTAARLDINYTLVPFCARPVLRVLHDQITVPLLTWRKVDVLITPATVGSLLGRPKQVVIVAAQFAIPSVRRESPAVRLSPLQLFYFGPIMRFSHRRADSVVAISSFIAKRLKAETGVSPEKLSVIPLGVDPPEETPVAERSLFLFLGTLSPHKNVEILVQAFASANPRLPVGTRVAIAGRDMGGQQKPMLESLARRLSVADSVDVLGKVDEEELERLFAQAVALVVPSQAEGFGLPVLEAMVRGVPVIAANRTALPEVVGDAGLVFEPDSPDELADLLVAVSTDGGLRRRLIEAGIARAEFLSWERTGEEFRKLLDALEATRPRRRPLVRQGSHESRF